MTDAQIPIFSGPNDLIQWENVSGDIALSDTGLATVQGFENVPLKPGAPTDGEYYAYKAADSEFELTAPDHKVLVDSSDTTPGYLNAKIDVTLPLTSAVGTPSGNETVNLAVNAATTAATGVVQLESSSSDTSASHVVTANDTRLSNSRTPTGSAGGDLGGTYPNPTVLSVADVTTGVLAAGNGGTGSSTVPTSAQIPIGNAGGTAYAPTTVSGDATLSNTGAVTLVNTAVTPGNYTSTNLTVDSKGRITAAANGSGGGITALTGDVTATGSGSVAATVAKVGGQAISAIAAGDLLMGSGSGALNRFPIGTAGQVPVATGGLLVYTSLNTLAAGDQLLFAITSTSSLTNTVTSKQSFTMSPSCTIPANQLAVGQQIEFIGALSITSSALSLPNVTYELDFGGTAVATFPATAMAASLSSGPAQIRIIGTVLTTGSSGTIRFDGAIIVQGATSTTPELIPLTSVSATVNTTTSNAVTMALTFSSTTQPNTTVLTQFGGVLHAAAGTSVAPGNGNMAWNVSGSVQSDNSVQVAVTAGHPVFGTTNFALTSATAIQFQAYLKKSSAGSNTGLGIGYISGGNYNAYVFVWNSGAFSGCSLYKEVAGTLTEIASGTGPANDTGLHKIRMVILPSSTAGNYISLYFDDVLVLKNFNDSSLNLLAQNANLGTYNDTGTSLYYDPWYRIGAL
jgi:hypothetical protein